MDELLRKPMPNDEREEIKKIVSALLLIPREDRAIILSNANAFRVRSDIEKAKK